MSTHKVVVRGTILEGKDAGSEMREEIDVECNPRIGDTLYSKNLDAKYVVDDVVEGSMEDTYLITTVYKHYPMSDGECSMVTNVANAEELQDRFNKLNLPGVYNGGGTSLIEFAHDIGDCPEDELKDVYIDAVWRDVTSVEEELELQTEEVCDDILQDYIVVDGDGRLLIPGDWSHEEIERFYGAVHLGSEQTDVGKYYAWEFSKAKAVYCVTETFTVNISMDEVNSYLLPVIKRHPNIKGSISLGYNDKECCTSITAAVTTSTFLQEYLTTGCGIYVSAVEERNLMIMPVGSCLIFKERYSIINDEYFPMIPNNKVLDARNYSITELTDEMAEELDLVEIYCYGATQYFDIPVKDRVQIFSLLLPDIKVFVVHDNTIYRTSSGSKADRVLLKVAKELTYAYFGVNNRDKLHKAIDKLCMTLNVWSPPAIYLCPVEFLQNLNHEFITEFLKYLFRLDRDRSADDICSKVKKCKYPAELISELQAYASSALQYPISTIGLYAPAEIRNQPLYRQLADANDVELLKQLVQEMSQIMLNEKPKALGLLLSAHQSNLDNASKERVVKELHKYIK